ncbi:MAG: outer membrane protein assembly factor BamD [Rhodospirillaceae bacterium]|jgi:outer membrane protein assembly factor BamD|nr:outer membrane protein assembly factor BamD [Rhodospirillaceae bacterium]MBT5809329.1 outer membrane protein assembly factor BamD [Rhodospirillaceae bacterium]
MKLHAEPAQKSILARPAVVRIVYVAALFLLAACADEKEPAYQARTVETLYNGGVNALRLEEYKQAVDAFDEVERQHPYSVWATKAQLMSAYASYKRDEYDEAIIGLDRFIELHPGNKDIAYAYYLKALSYYEQISDVARDQKMTRLALQSLQEVARRYPDTRYGRDARAKLDLTQDHLAGKEMTIGRYYQSRQEHLAAINRFKAVLKDYQTTTHVPEALHRITESYLALGVTDEAQSSTAVLGHNFPGSPWYQDSYALLEGRGLRPERKSDSWLSWPWEWVN